MLSLSINSKNGVIGAINPMRMMCPRGQIRMALDPQTTEVPPYDVSPLIKRLNSLIDTTPDSVPFTFLCMRPVPRAISFSGKKHRVQAGLHLLTLGGERCDCARCQD